MTDSPSLDQQRFTTTWRFLRMLGCEPNEAEDLAQEAILRLLRSPSLAKKPALEMQTWLLTVARNLLIDTRRRQGRMISVPWTQEVESLLTHELETHGSESVWTDTARACVATLAPRSAQIVQLFYRENRSRTEIAAQLGMTEAGVKTALQRARRTLKHCIERKLACNKHDPDQPVAQPPCETPGSLPS